MGQELQFFLFCRCRDLLRSIDNLPNITKQGKQEVWDPNLVRLTPGLISCSPSLLCATSLMYVEVYVLSWVGDPVLDQFNLFFTFISGLEEA